MSYERLRMSMKSLSLSVSLSLPLSLAFVAMGCSAGDPSSTEQKGDGVGASESELSLRALCAGPKGLSCKPTQYCAATEVGKCPSKAVYGVCTPRPDVCTDLYSPVCGCDGATYSNACFAAAAGAAVAKKGACEPKPAFCGGIAGIPCPDGEQCIDDPSDECDPKNGGADCGGICVSKPSTTFCGGIAAIPCPDGEQCIDDPSDDCDPKNGGADCGGICVAKTDPCAVVRCKAGTQCVNQGGVAACLTTESCGTSVCAPGLVCCNPLLSICTKPGGVCIF